MHSYDLVIPKGPIIQSAKRQKTGQKNTSFFATIASYNLVVIYKLLGPTIIQKRKTSKWERESRKWLNKKILLTQYIPYKRAVLTKKFQSSVLWPLTLCSRFFQNKNPFFLYIFLLPYLHFDNNVPLLSSKRSTNITM